VVEICQLCRRDVDRPAVDQQLVMSAVGGGEVSVGCIEGDYICIHEGIIRPTPL
jgi:hypothetical protein